MAFLVYRFAQNSGRWSRRYLRSYRTDDAGAIVSARFTVRSQALAFDSIGTAVHVLRALVPKYSGKTAAAIHVMESLRS
jgi:hypothetical protein